MVSLGSAFHPAHGKLIRTDDCAAILDQHEAFGLITLSLDELTLAKVANVEIRNQGQQMVSVDAFEEIDCPEELESLEKHVILHTFANDEHGLKLVDVEQVAGFTSSRRRTLLVKFLNLLCAQVFHHFIRHSQLAFEHA